MCPPFLTIWSGRDLHLWPFPFPPHFSQNWRTTNNTPELTQKCTFWIKLSSMALTFEPTILKPNRFLIRLQKIFVYGLVESVCCFMSFCVHKISFDQYCLTSTFEPMAFSVSSVSFVLASDHLWPVSLQCLHSIRRYKKWTQWRTHRRVHVGQTTQ